MTTYDDPTRLFMEKVAEGQKVAGGQGSGPHKKDEPTVKDYLKNTKTLLKILENPAKAGPKAALKSLLNLSLQKEGSLKPLSLFEFFNSHYGVAWWDWEPETMRKVIMSEHAIVPTREVMNMIGALQTVASTNAPFEHWDKFEKVGHALYGNIVDFRIVQPLEPDEAAVTFKYLKALRPGQEFEEEIYGYVAGCCNEAGMVFLPPDLYPEPCQVALAAQTHDKALEAEVAALYGHPENPVPRSGPARHQLQMLNEIREVLSDA